VYITFLVLVSRTVAQTVVLAKTDHVVFICIVVDIIFQNNAWWHLTFIEDNIMYLHAGFIKNVGPMKCISVKTRFKYI
jgi:hypothetical protein